ncbi:golgin candidate 6-like [Miscanthus floridulus]|uniref:golgin candidate 6-like n=1 Tax=Miscanthus floridulus TaxID=154761 RepID=UPI003458BBFF
MGKRRRRPPVPRNSRGGSPSSRRPTVNQARPMVADRGAGPAGNAAAGRARQLALAPSRGAWSQRFDPDPGTEGKPQLRWEQQGRLRRYVERYLDRISNGTIPDDRRSAMTELQSLVAESRSAQMSFGAMGFPILLNILKEDREDLLSVNSFVSILTPIETSQGPKTEVQPASVNSDLLSRETENISLLLSLLTEEDFYVRYYTIQLLTAILTNSLKRLQEAILLLLFIVCPCMC